MDITWICSCCDQSFDTLPMDYAFAAPRNWFGLTEAERTTRAMLNNDICTIDRNEITFGAAWKYLCQIAPKA
jgi:hypothetical protein